MAPKERHVDSELRALCWVWVPVKETRVPTGIRYKWVCFLGFQNWQGDNHQVDGPIAHKSSLDFGDVTV